MQHSPNEIKEKLLKALDQDNNVVDMGTVMEVITLLEKIQITKEALEKTRLGKYINELRKKTNNEILARRAKKLVRSWRKLIMPDTAVNGDRTVQTSAAAALDPGLKFLHTNKPVSPAMTNHRLHRHRSNSPIGVSSPIDSYCSSTSTSPALVLGYQGSRPSTPSVFAPKTKVASPEKDNPTSSAANLPSCIRQPSPPVTVSVQQKSHVVNDGDHNMRRYQPITSDSENNFHKPTKFKPRLASPALSINDKVVCSSHSLNVDVVAKTNAANKRLRKDVEDGINEDASRKKLCVDNNVDKHEPVNATKLNCRVANGIDCGDSNDSSRSIQEDFQEIEIKVPSEPTSTITKKGDKNFKVKKEASDSLKEKLATHARTNKVKTTAQLIEELSLKHNTSVSLQNVSSILPCQTDFNKASSSRASPVYARRLANNVLGINADHDMTKTKTELMEKFLRSSAVPDSGDGYGNASCASRSRLLKAESPASTAHDIKSGLDVKLGQNCIDDGVDPVEVILASLPPLKPEEIDWGEDDHDEVDNLEPKIEPVTDAVINKLHSEPWEGMNGNYDHEQKFREWHEALSRRSCNNDLLHILPYVNTD